MDEIGDCLFQNILEMNQLYEHYEKKLDSHSQDVANYLGQLIEKYEQLQELRLKPPSPKIIGQKEALLQEIKDLLGERKKLLTQEKKYEKFQQILEQAIAECAFQKNNPEKANRIHQPMRQQQQEKIRQGYQSLLERERLSQETALSQINLKPPVLDAINDSLLLILRALFEHQRSLYYRPSGVERSEPLSNSELFTKLVEDCAKLRQLRSQPCSEDTIRQKKDLLQKMENEFNQIKALTKSDPQFNRRFQQTLDQAKGECASQEASPYREAVRTYLNTLKEHCEKGKSECGFLTRCGRTTPPEQMLQAIEKLEKALDAAKSTEEISSRIDTFTKTVKGIQGQQVSGLGAKLGLDIIQQTYTGRQTSSPSASAQTDQTASAQARPASPST